MKDKTFNFYDFETELTSVTKGERLCALHMTLRNIPREYLEEYMRVPWRSMDRVFDNREKKND
jgi:hypothetical protein